MNSNETGWRFAPHPDAVAAYDAISRAVAAEQLPVDIPWPGDIPPTPMTPMQIMAAFPAAYSVKLTVLPDMTTVSWTGRFGIGGGNHEYVHYAVDPDSDEFPQWLADHLVPAIRRALECVTAEQRADLAEHGPLAPYEAVDAVQPLD